MSKPKKKTFLGLTVTPQRLKKLKKTGKYYHNVAYEAVITAKIKGFFSMIYIIVVYFA